MPKFICSKCGKSADFETPIFACECGGLYDLEFKAAIDLNLIDQREFSLFRYREFFPIKNELWRNISLGEGLTKSVKFDDSLYLKMDYAMPTLSFKDRGAVMLIWFCKTHGIKRSCKIAAETLETQSLHTLLKLALSVKFTSQKAQARKR